MGGYLGKGPARLELVKKGGDQPWMERLSFPAWLVKGRSRGGRNHPSPWSSSPHLLFLLVMLEKEAWGQPPGSWLALMLPHAAVDAREVSLVVGVMNLLVP